MGMLLRRHYADGEPVKPVEQTEAESVKEMPKEDKEQAVVTEDKRKAGKTFAKRKEK